MCSNLVGYCMSSYPIECTMFLGTDMTCFATSIEPVLAIIAVGQTIVSFKSPLLTLSQDKWNAAVKACN